MLSRFVDSTDFFITSKFNKKIFSHYNKFLYYNKK